MGRYFRVYRTFFTSSFARELEFRANFFAKILHQIVWVGFFMLMLLVIFSRTETVAGWTRSDVYVLAASLFLVEALWRGCFMALLEFPQMIRQGTLDFVLTRPVDPQFWVSLRRFNFDQVGVLVTGVVMLVYALFLGKYDLIALDIVGYLLLLPCALAIFYAFNVAMITTAIWFIRVDNLWILGETVLTVARNPIDIFGNRVGKVFTYWIPFALLATVPARQLVRGFDFGAIVLGFAWAITALVLLRLFWNYALRNYGSASS